MQVAMALGLLIIIIIIVLSLIGMLIGGIVLTVCTVRRHKKRKSQGLKADAKQIFMTVMCVLLLIGPIGAGGAIIADKASLAIKRAGYRNFTDRWRNELVLNAPEKESINELLKMAEAGDADGIYASFAQGQRGDRLRGEIETFLEKYPKGLSECEIDMRGGLSGGNGKEETFSFNACAEKDGYFYYFYCAGCYRSDTPSKLGITDFSIVSQDIYAINRVNDSIPLSYKNIYCLLKPSEPVDVVVIRSTAYFRENVNTPIAYDAALRAVKELSDKNDYVERFGEPAVRDIGWYWEVEADGDMSRYLCIYPKSDGSVDKKAVQILGRNDNYKHVKFDENGNIRND